MKNASAKRPSHRAYQVSKDGNKSFWREIGAVWAHDDGKGYNIKLDCFPVDGNIVIREPKDDAKEGGAQ